MKVVSLNIRHGGGQRVAQIRDWLNSQAADLILLTEWRANWSGQFLQQSLEKSGYLCSGQAREPAANGLLIASKRSFAVSRITPNGSRSGEISEVALDEGFTVLGCYFPQLQAKQSFFAECLRVAGERQGLLIVGDLNTGNNVVDLEVGAAKFACADQFDELVGRGNLTDLWRKVHGPISKEWTWRSKKNGFRIDHAFGDTALQAQFPEIACDYDHLTRGTITDHSALIIDLRGPLG